MDEDERRDESPSEALLRAARERLKERAETDDTSLLAERHSSEAQLADEVTDPDREPSRVAPGDAGVLTGTRRYQMGTPEPQDDEPFWDNEDDPDEDHRAASSPDYYPTAGPVSVTRGGARRVVVTLAFLIILIGVALTVFLAADGSGTSSTDDTEDLFAAGECLVLSPSGVLDRDHVVPCDQPHQFEVIGTAVLAGGSYPADASIEEIGVPLCMPHFATYVGSFEQGPWYAYPLYPTEEAWDQGDREIACTAVQYAEDGNWLPVTGSARGAG